MTVRRDVRRRCGIVCGLIVGLACADQVAAQSEVDAFMEKVLERRDENRSALGSYVLDETETFEVRGPGRLPLQSYRRDYSWYVRDGYLIRSPVEFDGVAIGEQERREYEETWLRQERRRAANRQRQPRPLSRRSTFENVRRTIERLWGRPVSDGLTRQISEDARLWLDDMAAIVVAADRILDDLGGIDDVGFATVTARARDGFSMLETDRLDRDEVAAVVSVLLVELADEVSDASPREVDAFIELVQLSARFELAIPDTEEAIADALDVVAARDMAQAEVLEEAQRELLSTAIASSPARQPDDAPQGGAGAEARTLQPRFVSESFFMDFPFEPGNYFFSGRDVVVGRDVVKVEYYPEQLFAENSPVPENERDETVVSGFERTSLVTLWIDPEQFQIVRFRFDNVGFDFLPMRWLVRLDDLQASMEMGQPIEGVWLPEQIELTGQLTMANGSFTVRYARTFSEYRRADVSATIRSYGPTRD